MDRGVGADADQPTVLSLALGLSSLVTKATHAAAIVTLASVLLLCLSPRLFARIWRLSGVGISRQWDETVTPAAGASESVPSYRSDRTDRGWSWFGVPSFVGRMRRVLPWLSHENDCQIEASLLKAVEKADRDGVERISFVPTSREVGQLLRRAVLAEVDRASGKRSRLLSKLPHIDTLCPPSLRAGDTVLAQLGRAKANGNPGSRFVVIHDKALVYWMSNGPNAVMHSPDDSVINLFSVGTRENVNATLDEYFAARAALLGQIVSMVADKIRQCSVGPSGAVATAFPPLPLPSGLQIDVGSVRATCAGGGGGSGGGGGGGNTSSVRSSSSSGGASRRCRSGGRGSGNIEGASGGAQTSGVHKYVTVPPELWPSYARVAGMFDKAAAVFAAELASAGPSSEPMDILRKSVGLEVVSFCQTWMRGDTPRACEAEFSVMSPHFQNRVVVVDANRLAMACNLTTEDLESYLAVLDQLSRGMEKEGYTRAFVHLDRLRTSMAKRNRKI